VDPFSLVEGRVGHADVPRRGWMRVVATDVRRFVHGRRRPGRRWWWWNQRQRRDRRERRQRRRRRRDVARMSDRDSVWYGVLSGGWCHVHHLGNGLPAGRLPRRLPAHLFLPRRHLDVPLVRVYFLRLRRLRRLRRI